MTGDVRRQDRPLPDGVLIRTFVDDDLDEVIRLWDATDHVGAMTEAQIAAKRDRDPDLLLVATSGDRLVGMVVGTFDGWRGFVWRLAVASAHRRRGIGHALVDEVEARMVLQ